MNEDKTTISAVHGLGDAISYACGGRYEASIYYLLEAKKELELLRDKYELGIGDEDEN